jgi:hypothetical protein
MTGKTRKPRRRGRQRAQEEPLPEADLTSVDVFPVSPVPISPGACCLSRPPSDLAYQTEPTSRTEAWEDWEDSHEAQGAPSTCYQASVGGRELSGCLLRDRRRRFRSGRGRSRSAAAELLPAGRYVLLCVTACVAR